MQIKRGAGTTSFGPGVVVELNSDEVALALYAWLVGRGVFLQGPRTVRLHADDPGGATVYVDPSGAVFDGLTCYPGRTGEPR